MKNVYWWPFLVIECFNISTTVFALKSQFCKVVKFVNSPKNTIRSTANSRLTNINKLKSKLKSRTFSSTLCFKHEHIKTTLKTWFVSIRWPILTHYTFNVPPMATRWTKSLNLCLEILIQSWFLTSQVSENEKWLLSLLDLNTDSSFDICCVGID